MKWSLALLFCVGLCCAIVAADQPVTSVHGRDVRWNGVCLAVPNRFQPMGSFDFTLPQSAGARTVFVEERGNAVSVMVVVQTEHMTSASDRYDYPLQPGVEVGGVRLKINAFAAADSLNVRRSPNAETALTDQFLVNHGLSAPDEWLKVRYATYDAAGKNEFLVFYMEPLDTATLDLAAVGPSDLTAFATAFDRVRQRAGTILTFTAC
jgi:hypothetical protein